MCMIIVKPVGVELPTEGVLDRCALINRDGIGVAWTHDSMVKIKKDFNDVDAFKSFMAKTLTKQHAALIHFRIATAGKVDEGNRHPFPLTRRNKRLRALESVTDIAVAHNGTFTDLKGHKKYSDTMLFIKNVLSDPIVRNNLYSDAIHELISGYLDTSKLAVLDRMGKITKFGYFYEENGLWYSNGGYKKSETVYYGGVPHSMSRNDIQLELDCKDKWKRQCIDCFQYDWKGLMHQLSEYSYVCKECNDKRLDEESKKEGFNAK